eukprot:gene11641-34350_t
MVPRMMDLDTTSPQLCLSSNIAERDTPARVRQPPGSLPKLVTITSGTAASDSSSPAILLSSKNDSPEAEPSIDSCIAWRLFG